MLKYFTDIATIFNIIGVIMMIESGIVVLSKYVLPYIPNISPNIIDLGCYTLGAALAFNKAWLKQYFKLSDTSSFWISMPGHVIIPVTVMNTLDRILMHNISYNVMITFAIIFTIYFGSNAIWYQSSLLGLISTMCFIVSIGGALYVGPGFIAVDIKESYWLFFNHITCYSVLGYIVLTHYNIINSYYTNPFRFGILFGCAFYHYLSSLYLSMYDNFTNDMSGYIYVNIVTFASLLGGYVLGGALKNSTGKLELSHLRNTATFMLFLFCIEKMYDIPWNTNIHLICFLLGTFMVFSPIVIREKLIPRIIGTVSVSK